MTLQEIKERIAAYESKWGKLGHTNIMKPENEIQHSSLNERRNTMIKTTNDFYKFRQKVAIGKEANKLAHKATISPEELNERNFQNQIDNNTLIHASRNGNEREVHKYYKKEEVNGKPRYFYSQEEYDAFKNNKGTAASAGSAAGELLKNAGQEAWMNQKRSEAAERVAQREMEESKRRSDALDNYNNNARAESVKKIVEVSKNGGSKAAADAMKDNPDYKLYMEMIQYAVDKGVDPQEHTVNETGKLLGKDYADAIKDAENNLKEYFDAVPGLSDDLSVIALDELNEIRKKNKKETVLESVGDKLGEDLSKPITKNVKHSAFDEDDEIPSYKTAADLRQEREESIMSEYRAFKARANKGAEKNRLSHSAVISPRDLNAKYEEELMKEYIAIHPEEDDDIEHSSNGRAYINKIDKYYPDGSARYFYTQAEWDAYQEGLKRSQYESNKKAQESEKKISAYNAKKEADSRNNMSGYADYKKAQSAKAEADTRNNMSGYADFKKTQNAKAEADSKNNMGGYKDWKEGQEAKKSAQAKLDEMNKSAQENEAKKLAAQKTEASRRSGMDDYEEYQKEQKEEEYKTRAKQKAGMEGYAAYNKAKEAKNEADSRNDMSGYNQWKEDTAKAKKEADQKSEAAKRSGMEGYEQYQQDKKTEAQKADMAKRQGMEGREEWDKEQKAEKEANAKKVAEDRNDMSGYAAWKRRRDYINNQKKASEAADAAEAEKHEIERKAVKNSVEVTKNKAASKAQEDAESAKRKEEERAANAKKDAASKEAAMKAGQKSTMQEAENAARDKEHKADKEKAKWNNLNNNITSILEKASKKYDSQLEALNREYDSIKDKSSPEAKAIKDKISQTNTKKDAELDKEIMTVVKDLGEIFNDLEDKNGPEAKLLKAQARRALDYSSNTKLAEVMGETNSWINARMKYPKEV